MDRTNVDHLLTTTRSVRKRLDLTRPVEAEVIRECLEIAIQAPNGGNQNRYHFIVVTDAAKRATIGDVQEGLPRLCANPGAVAGRTRVCRLPR
jgi:nitroreductase